MKPKLLFAYRFGLLGGVSSQLLNRLDAFSRAYDIRVLFERDSGVVARFPNGTASAEGVLSRQADLIEQFAPDVMVSIDSPGMQRAWELAGSPGRLVLEVHTTTDTLSYVRSLTLSHRVDVIVTVSSFMATLLEEMGLGTVAPIRIVPNCLGAMWRSIPKVAPPDAPIILWVGKLDDHKRWDRFVDVIERLPDERSRAVLVGGATATNRRVTDLLQRLKGSPRAGRIIWVPSIPYDRMPSLFATTAASGGLSVMTSKNESFGMTAAESFAMGCPVVAPSVGALPEFVPAAALYRADRWDEAADLITRALDDRAVREDLLADRVEVVRRMTDPETSLEMFQAALASCL